MEAADLWNDTHSINLLIYSSLGFTLVGVDFRRLILYTVVLFAPDHQHSLLVRAWDRIGTIFPGCWSSFLLKYLVNNVIIYDSGEKSNYQVYPKPIRDTRAQNP